MLNSRKRWPRHRCVSHAPGISDIHTISFGLGLWSRCLASYPNAHRHLFPFQLDSTTHQVAVRRLSDGRPRVHSTSESNESDELEHVFLKFYFSFVIPSASRDREFHFGLGPSTSRRCRAPQHRTLRRTTGNDCIEDI